MRFDTDLFGGAAAFVPRPLPERELVVVGFAGGGGSCTGIAAALGRAPDIAINHDAWALAVHAANHPATLHLSRNIWQVDPHEAVKNRPVGLAWFSPDCKHFSKAKGGRPVKRSIRDLAWVVVLWAKRARRLVIRSYMGFGSNAHASQAKGHRSTGFRANSNRSGTTPAQDWANYPDVLPAIVERFAGVVVECRPAIDVMRQHDGPSTLHYVDPPYLPETRAQGNPYDLRWRMYRHELTREDHAALLEALSSLAGMVVLSGYPDPLYDARLAGWRRVETRAYADGARERTEVLWLNPAACAALDAAAPQMALFAREAAE